MGGFGFKIAKIHLGGKIVGMSGEDMQDELGRDVRHSTTKSGTQQRWCDARMTSADGWTGEPKKREVAKDTQ